AARAGRGRRLPRYRADRRAAVPGRACGAGGARGPGTAGDRVGRARGRRPRAPDRHRRGVRRFRRRLPRRRGRGRRRRVPHRRPASSPGQRVPRRRWTGPGRRRTLGNRAPVARRAGRRADRGPRAACGGLRRRHRPLDTALPDERPEGAEPVKADPDAQRRLLELQAIDTALAQLAHRRRTLPEHAELGRLAREIAVLDDARIKAQVTVDDLDRDIARLEKDTEQVRARAARDQARLDAGTGPAKELEALQHELGSLARRQSELEDAELELMEQRETAEATLTGAQSRLAAVRARQDAAQTARDEALRQIAQDEEFRSAGRRPRVAAAGCRRGGRWGPGESGAGGVRRRGARRRYR